MTEPAPTSPAFTPAFKEWAVIVQALLEGEQILDIRKGGLHETGRHFGVQSNRAWLFPTIEHQREGLVKPAYRRWITAPDADQPSHELRFDGWAEIVGVATVDDTDVLDALDGKVIWSREYVESRFRWKSRDPLFVLALRVHVLAETLVVPNDDSYGGCTSWIDVAGLPDPRTLASRPALSDAAFAARLKGAADAIPGGFVAPTP